MGVENFYFRKNESDEVYNPNGNTWGRITDYTMPSDHIRVTAIPVCKFFDSIYPEDTPIKDKIREYIPVPYSISKFDTSFQTKPLWEGKTFVGEEESRPATKYDTYIMDKLCYPREMVFGQPIPPNHTAKLKHYESFAPADGAGVILIAGGGGGGGGGDDGGWLNEPAGGAGGGGGGWVLFYYRYKKMMDQRPLNDCLLIGFGSPGGNSNYQANGGSRRSPGQSGCPAYLTYRGQTLITCGGGGGGASDGSSNTLAGGGYGMSYVHVNTIDDDNLFYTYIIRGDGSAGQDSGEGGTNEDAKWWGRRVPEVPSIHPNGSVIVGGYYGGHGGKKDESDPGGGGGGCGVCGTGGNGSNGDGPAGDGGDTAGGGGASERNSYAGKGGYACAVEYIVEPPLRLDSDAAGY